MKHEEEAGNPIKRADQLVNEIIRPNKSDFDSAIGQPEFLKVSPDYVSRYTLIIGKPDLPKDCHDVSILNPGTGIFVELDSQTYGILTVAHVLNRSQNREERVSVSLIQPIVNQRHMAPNTIVLKDKECTVEGFNNKSADGPDIAIIPLESDERKLLEDLGKVAYNLQKTRFSDNDRKELKGKSGWSYSMIYGLRYKASQLVQQNRGRNMGALVTIGTVTRIDKTVEREGFDYHQLPCATTEYSIPPWWDESIPEEAAKEFERIELEGVKQESWAGTSGAGVWNLIVADKGDSQDNKRVYPELAGVCFCVNEEEGCIIAHGKGSISRIADRHMKKVRPLIA